MDSMQKFPTLIKASADADFCDTHTHKYDVTNHSSDVAITMFCYFLAKPAFRVLIISGSNKIKTYICKDVGIFTKFNLKLNNLIWTPLLKMKSLFWISQIS